MNLTSREWIYLILPAATGYLVSSQCHIGKEAGVTIKARPPSWVFGTVWPLLYILLGLSWVYLRRENTRVDLLFGFNLLAMMCWIILYGCGGSKQGGLYVLWVTLMLSVMLWGWALRSDTSYPTYMLAPYVCWLLFALLLNYQEVNQEK